ncbi:MAG: hypothetical protein WCD57_10370 [Acidobacteriaceae bacterium]
MNTTTATNPLVQLVDQLSKQAAAIHAVLQREIAASSRSDPDDQVELEALRKIFAENSAKIEALIANQVTTLEELLEIGGC